MGERLGAMPKTGRSWPAESGQEQTSYLSADFLARELQVLPSPDKSKGLPSYPQLPRISAAHGGVLQKQKSSLDSAWQRLVTQAIGKGVLIEDERSGPYDFKRKGITDTDGTWVDKQQTLDNRSEVMLDVYDLSIPAGRQL
ncbi:hypothetical protein [Azotobacter chroococcum]|uniref:hypothetical protein n=1 Tax=Azotobacter chroococcum TaxID=353 RepID=UPI0010ADC3A8|nr:hypothetical protein [Azotobacter chroococcum]TKD29922.1 hypothetical protein FCG41_24675 [Azotobacter chroococcum]